jgi:hypothetical protein
MSWLFWVLLDNNNITCYLFDFYIVVLPFYRVVCELIYKTHFKKYGNLKILKNMVSIVICLSSVGIVVSWSPLSSSLSSSSAIMRMPIVAIHGDHHSKIYKQELT